MNNETIDDIIATLSQRRFETYLRAAGFNRGRALALYHWNARIGSAFHFPLQAVEVALRNRINHALVAEFGTNWWKCPELNEILDRERIRDLDQVKRRIGHKRLSLETDQIVASLSFGFWVGMLHKRYNPGIWGRHLRSSFSHAPDGTDRQEINRLAGRIAQFRNRVSHHEPLIRSNIQQHYSDILLLLK